MSCRCGRHHSRGQRGEGSRALEALIVTEALSRFAELEAIKLPPPRVEKCSPDPFRGNLGRDGGKQERPQVRR